MYERFCIWLFCILLCMQVSLLYERDSCEGDVVMSWGNPLERQVRKWILSFYLVVSTSRRSTTRGIPLFFLTIFLPYIFHQSHSSCDHPYISHISTTRGIPLFFLTIFLSYIFPVPLILWPSIYIYLIYLPLGGSRCSSSLFSFPTYSTSPTHPVTIHMYLIYPQIGGSSYSSSLSSFPTYSTSPSGRWSLEEE
jgi:hypothetical protein